GPIVDVLTGYVKGGEQGRGPALDRVGGADRPHRRRRRRRASTERATSGAQALASVPAPAPHEPHPDLGAAGAGVAPGAEPPGEGVGAAAAVEGAAGTGGRKWMANAARSGMSPRTHDSSRTPPSPAAAPAFAAGRVQPGGGPPHTPRWGFSHFTGPAKAW